MGEIKQKIAPRDEVRSPTRANRISSTILFIVVALAPLPFGSTDPSTVAFWCTILGICLIFSSPESLHGGRVALLGLAAAVLVAYALVLHEQLSPHPWIASADPLWRQASAALQFQLEPSASIARNQPLYAMGAPLAAILAGICAFIVCTDQERARQLLKVVAWSGACYAAFGIVSFLLDPTKILWREKQAYQSFLTSTFINRNTAAVYFGSCVVLWLLLLSEDIRGQLSGRRIKLAQLFNHLLRHIPRRTLLSFSMLLLCLAAMGMTGSRAGVVLSLMVAIASGIGYFRRDLLGRRGLFIAALSGCVIVLILLGILGGGVNSRFDAEGIADGGRLETYRSTLRMIADHPWFGTGLGTYVWSYPAYRSPSISMWGIWNRAHSVPLEIVADLGLPLVGFITLAWIIVLTILVFAVQKHRHNMVNVLAALSVAILALLHSAIDFSLQITGYAIVAFALIGGGLAQATTTSRPNGASD